MLVSLNDILISARRGKYAVGLSSTVNLELTRGVMEAAGELDSPVTIETVEVLLPYGPIEDPANLLTPITERVSVPVMVHLDHGLEEETYRQALDLGFSSIMYDCSIMEYEANIEHVKRMAKTAHVCRTSTEAKPGHVGDNGREDPSLPYTDSAQARDFIEGTGVDALAIAVDTVHGAYKLPPKLDFNRITEIAENIPTPLVLHGDPGLSGPDFRTAVERGIGEVNIFTDINQACARAAVFDYKEGMGLTDIILPEIRAVKQSMMEKMRLFESVGWGGERQGRETGVGCTWLTLLSSTPGTESRCNSVAFCAYIT